MRKTEVKTVPERVVKATKKEVLKIYCDICEKDVTKSIYAQCILCKRETCYEHYKVDPEEWGDYPDRYCITCFNLKFVGHYEELRDNLRDEYYAELKRIDEEIRKKSLRNE